MSTIQEQLREEVERLSGHSIRHGVAESGIASNLADAAADRIDALEADNAALRAKVAEAAEGVNHALMVLPVPDSGPGKRAWSSLIDARTTLQSIRSEAK